MKLIIKILLVLIVASPFIFVGAHIILLQRGFEKNVSVYPNAQKISGSWAGDGSEINPVPTRYSTSYKIDPNISIATVREFYVKQLEQKGWEFSNINQNNETLYFSRNNEKITIFLGCNDQPDSTAQTPKSGKCIDEDVPSQFAYYLQVQIDYSN